MENLKKQILNCKTSGNGPQSSATVPAKRSSREALLSPPLSSDSLSPPGELTLPESLEYTEVAVPTRTINPHNPRQYQIELYDKAVVGNIISVLDTGSGKTLIAIMLIKEMAARERTERAAQPERLCIPTCLKPALHNYQTKLSVFLVERVPLVFQQARAIDGYCDLRVGFYCGQMGVDLWGVPQWSEIMETKDVLVMTAQIFLNMLRHGLVSLNRVNLLIFDECHHAKLKHPYNLIMREFYDGCPEESRPKIFGMTASPVSSKAGGSKAGVHSTASQLEKTLDAQIFTASNLTEFRRLVNRPSEYCVDYDTSPPYEPTPLHKVLSSECLSLPRLRRVLNTTTLALQTLGPWCADRVWHYTIDEIGSRFEARAAQGVEDLDKLREEEEAVGRMRAILKDTVCPPPQVDNPALFSPKVQKLLRILEYYNMRPEKLCGIVFVQTRHTATVLGALVEKTPNLMNVKCGVLIGHGTQEEGDVSMGFKQQNRMITKFKNGQINLLIATNVAEEGLDIQPCSLVVRFDFFQTLIAYIQSRGRARHRDSRYVLMVEKGNNDQLNMLKNAQLMEEEMKQWCQALPADRKAMMLSQDEDDNNEDLTKYSFYRYGVPSTGALITLNSATALVHHYCAKLPTDKYCTLRPHFELISEGVGYRCRLRLPPNSAVLEIVSEVFDSKEVAKRAVSLEACTQLHRAGALNDHLLPELESDEMEEEYRDEKGLREGSSQRRNRYPMKVPEFWALGEASSIVALRRLFITVLQVNLSDGMDDEQVYRTLCLLTRDSIPRIPSFLIYFQGVVGKTVNILSMAKPISVDDEKVESLYKFTMKLCSSIANKDFLCPLEEVPFLVAPMVQKAHPVSRSESSDGLIDWHELKTATENWMLPVNPDDTDALTDAIIIDTINHQRRYFVQAVRRDMNPRSPITQSMQISGETYKDFTDYYRREFKLEVQHPDQPLIEVRKMPRALNFLQPIPSSPRKLKSHIFIPEFCQKLSISASVFRSALLLPSLLMRMDAYLGVQEFRAAHGLHIDDHWLLEAFTTPSAHMEKNYERLETLGDSILKLIVTIHVYIRFPGKHEGQLHSKRARVVCNRALYKSAVDLHLFERILSKPFIRRSWRPPRFTTTLDNQSSRQEREEHELSDKTLADVIEASLAAAYLTDGLESALQCCIVMRVPLDPISTWSDFNKAYIAAGQHEPPASRALRLLDIARIVEITGYTFTNPFLLAEALTHASFPNSTCPCYQRLEFLGDAVLDFLVTRHLFHRYPNAAPGLLSELKEACVNNHILGIVCIRIGLHRHLAHFSAPLVGVITGLVEELEEMRQQDECKGEYWLELDVPKVISDVVESMLGAVFVDSGFKMEAVEKVFARWLEPLMDEHVGPETLKGHPMKKLTERLQRNGCGGLLIKTNLSKSDPESQECKVFIHNRLINNATSNNVRNARKTATAQVNIILDENPKLLEHLCDCPSKRTRYTDEDSSDDEGNQSGCGLEKDEGVPAFGWIGEESHTCTNDGHNSLFPPRLETVSVKCDNLFFLSPR
ncbi:putative dicer-like protein [Endogone sp. FLAS-F59071]|nr:putative dicer-like protein [Endogone sp. FLAS-F59071]|eukprot:RUS20581.1 putative dicer-like protein [Endogone sp. FLAS-F59071]